MDPEVDRRIDPIDPYTDAGMVADPADADLIGAPPFEEEAMADDILPDHIERFPNAPEPADEASFTARPSVPDPMEGFEGLSS